MAWFSIYSSFIRNAFLKMLAYRLRYYTGIFTYLLFVAVYYFIWEAIYADKPAGATVNGYTLPQMLTYISIGWIARSSYFSNIDDEIDDLVRSGQVSIYLLRPVNFQVMMMAQAVGESLFRILFFSMPILAVILLAFPVSGPQSTEAFVLFFVSSSIGFIVLAALNFIIGLLAFYFNSIDGIMRAKYNLVTLASGLVLPLTFFPDWLRWPLEALPFKTISYIPLNFYLGKLTLHDGWSALASQLGWALALLALGAYMWSRAAAKLTLQGG